MPSKRIIILDRLDLERRTWQCAFWADVPVERQPFYARPEPSVWKGASLLEHQDIQDGKVAELVSQVQLEAGSTIPQAQAAAELSWQKWQDWVNSNNPWQRYGTYWTGTQWVQGGVS